MKPRGRSPVASGHASGSASASAAPPQRGGGAKSEQHLLQAEQAQHQRLLSASSAGGRLPSETGSDYGAGGGHFAAEMSVASPAHLAESSAAMDSSADNSGGLGNSIFYDDPDLEGSFGHQGQGIDPEMTQKAMDQIQSKIEKTKELIKEEQTSRDDNVNEYLKLSSNADRQQQARIKQVFEKKNQKSAQNIAHYGKKLEEYQRRMQDLQEHGLRPKQSHKLGQGLKNVGGNIRDGLTGMSSSVMSKPKEFAHLIRHKFGSADNLAAMSKEEGSGDGKKDRNHHGSASLPRENSGLSGGGGGEGGGGGTGSGGGGGGRGSDRHSSLASQGNRRKCISDDGGGRSRSDRSESLATSSEVEEQQQAAAAEASSDRRHHKAASTSGHSRRGQESQQQQLSGGGSAAGGGDSEQQQQQQRRHHTSASSSSAEWKAVMQELVLHREEVEHLREEMDEQRQQFKSEVESLTYQLREERDRCERLEEQVNDLTELHQHEIENIKSGVGDMEEKVQYQSEERLLDIKEHLQALETKVTSIEHQQTQQQYLNIEGLDSTDARAVMMKLLTACITFVHVMLFVVGALMGVARPFLRTTPRAIATVCVVSLAIYANHQQEAIVALYRRLRPPPLDADVGEL